MGGSRPRLDHAPERFRHHGELAQLLRALGAGVEMGLELAALGGGQQAQRVCPAQFPQALVVQ